MELSDIYSDKIIEIAGSLPITDRLQNPSASARKVSRVCGSIIEVDINIEDGIVTDYAHEVSACALGQTSASIVAQNIVGASSQELLELQTQMRAMFKENGRPPKGRWEDLKYLQPVREYPARHMSTLLVFDAVAQCVSQLAENNETA